MMIRSKSPRYADPGSGSMRYPLTAFADCVRDTDFQQRLRLLARRNAERLKDEEKRG